MREIRASGGVAETSFYPALRTLLNEVGGKLKPKVRCTIHPQALGAGLPDGGLFTPDQIPKGAAEPIVGTPPARGAIEAKPVADDMAKTVKSEQVAKYLAKYQQILVTNYRDFVLVARGDDGGAQTLETYSLAAGADEFWEMTAHSSTAAKIQSERFAEFLMRVMLHPAPVSDPKHLAWFLASYAREARYRVEHRKLPALDALRGALEQALGIKFEDEKGEHFFRSTLVQTLFYGVFAAWVLWARGKAAKEKTFDWKLASQYLQVPFVDALFYEVAAPKKLKELGVDEVLDWAGNVLNRVAPADFFKAFEEEHAVQYFYEPFLQAYDPDLRKQLGVWYTPPEVVTYMVERVDAVLRSELDIVDGLADDRVFVLDPCCGTGSYLVEVLRRIHKTLLDKGEDALTANRVKDAALKRVFGFEIMPAPFVIAHLQLGLALRRLGAPLNGKGKERAGVFLTNALTGWEPPEGPKQHILALPELETERDAAAEVKQDKPILVILGNPPYNGYAGVAIAEERALTQAYRVAKRAPQPQGQGLNDLYVRFYRMAERKITEMTGRGVVCLISNYSWLDGLSFSAMRERYLEQFDSIRIDCLNGDKYRTGKLTPDGGPDPSIFSTERNREGIQVGTAIALLSRRSTHHPSDAVRFRNLWGRNKRAELLETAHQDGDSVYERLTPPLEIGLPFMPAEVTSEYLNWPRLPELFPVSFPGVKTSRDDLVVDIDRDRLIERMRRYFDPKVSDAEAALLADSTMRSTARYDAPSIRRRLIEIGFSETAIRRYQYRPFDIRWVYWESETKLLDEKREEYVPQVLEGNIWLEARQKQTLERFDRGYATRFLADNFGNGLSNFFPLVLAPIGARRSPLLTNGQAAKRHNLSRGANAYLSGLGAETNRLFYHVLATLNSPEYRSVNRAALRQDWPRIPLPNTKDRLVESADLGCRIAALLDTEAQVEGVTSGDLRSELKTLAVISREGGGALRPDKGELALTAGWGHAGKGGAVMPGKGRVVERNWTDAEAKAIAEGAAALGMKAVDVKRLLGGATCDVYLNQVAYWRNIPIRVWEYTIGGYQVIKKWLSYRERDLLGRDLKPEEITQVKNMARRIAAIILMGPALDANYRAVAADTYPWSRAS